MTYLMKRTSSILVLLVVLTQTQLILADHSIKNPLLDVQTDSTSTCIKGTSINPHDMRNDEMIKNSIGNMTSKMSNKGNDIESIAQGIVKEDDESWDDEEEEWDNEEWDDEEEEWDDEEWDEDEWDEEEWGEYKVNKIWDNLGCEDIFSTERPIHSQQKWKQAIDIYHAIILDRRLDPLKNGFSVGIEAKQTEGKGRGIYATHPIKKGELVWSSKRTARFDDGDDYRHFLSVLDVDFACDVLQWAYVQDVSDSDEHQELQISVDLDEGCFCNDGGDGEPSSVGCDEDEAVNFEGGCRSNYFALRDIEAGEELLCNYDEFALPDGWKEFGLDLPNSIWLEGIWS